MAAIREDQMDAASPVDSSTAWRIVIGTDGSPCASQAQELISRFPFPAGTEIEAVGVALNAFIMAGAYGDAGYLNCQVNQELVDAERELLTTATSQAVEHLAQPGWTVTSEVKVGDISQELLLAARQFRANLVVVGSRGLTGLNRLLLGSTARNVARYSTCPVLVARGTAAGPERVILAVDGSEHSSRAVELLSALPLPSTPEVSVVHVLRAYHPVLERLEFLPGARERLAPRVEAARQEQQAIAERLVSDACARLRAAGKRAVSMTRTGHPAEEILSLIEGVNADLVVLGARGVSLVEGVLVGSVADAVLQHARCSVLLAH